MKRITVYLYSIFILVFVSGCTTKPTHLELVVKSHNEINLDSDNVSSPLMLNFYELDSAEQFLKLDYWTLVDNGKDRLNSDLISQNKHIIVPNEQQDYKILFSDQAKFLGIIGNFRQLDANNTWRHVINLNEESYNYTELEIQDYSIKEVQ